MKNIFKKTLSLTIICSLFMMLSCEKDLYEEPIRKDNTIKHEKISLTKMMAEINDQSIINYLNTFKSSYSLDNSNKSGDEPLYFEKYTKEDQYTNYKYTINEYSVEKPYFLELVIKKDSISEKAGFIKYMPDLPTDVLDTKRFTGKIEVLNLLEHKVASKLFNNGVPVYVEDSFASGECVSNIDLIQYNCTHGGNHAPGESCNNGNINDGYYEIVITTFCYDYAEDYNFITAPDMLMGGSSNSRGGATILTAEDIAFNNFVTTLSPEQAELLANTPGLIQYIRDNEVSPDITDAVRQLLAICINNNATFTLDSSVTGNNLTLDELQNQLSDNFSNHINQFEIETIPSIDNGFIGRCRIKINTFYGIRIGMNFTTTANGQYSLAKQDISSDLYGLFAFTEWTQLSSQCTVNNNFNGRIKVILYGKLHQQYTIPPFNGVNINQFIRIILLIDKNTGETISTEWYYD